MLYARHTNYNPVKYVDPSGHALECGLLSDDCGSKKPGPANEDNQGGDDWWKDVIGNGLTIASKIVKTKIVEHVWENKLFDGDGGTRSVAVTGSVSILPGTIISGTVNLIQGDSYGNIAFLTPEIGFYGSTGWNYDIDFSLEGSNAPTVQMLNQSNDVTVGLSAYAGKGGGVDFSYLGKNPGNGEDMVAIELLFGAGLSVSPPGIPGEFHGGTSNAYQWNEFNIYDLLKLPRPWW